MIEDDWVVYCPTYKRESLAISHKLFTKEKFYYVVEEEEAHLYEKLGTNLEIIPKKNRKSNIAIARNHILENSKYRNIIMVDDDLSKIVHINKREREFLSIEQTQDFIDMMFEIAYSFGIGLWGINLIHDPMAYSINKPFSFHTPVLGTFCAHIIDELRYDEDLFLKEDYDLFLQKIKKFGFCLRANYISYECDHQKLAGGCQEYRSTAEEDKQKKMFQKKWGSDFVRYNERNSDSINMRIRI